MIEMIISPRIRPIFIVLILVFIALSLTMIPAQAQKRLALVVGNDAYENVTKLQKAANDARGMAQTLEALGFKVTKLTDTSRREMNRAIQDFNNSIDEGDIVLFFFAGHGVEIDGENYLLPVDVPDAKSDQLEFIKSETIRLNTVLADLRARKSRLNLVILDACRNNPFSGSAGRSLGGRQGLARISAPQGTFVMYSADVGETALDRLTDDDGNPNSIFTRTLIPLMKTPGVDLVSTARQARRKVRKLALSVSHNQTPAYYDAVLGDFYFTPPKNSDGGVISVPNVEDAPIATNQGDIDVAVLDRPAKDNGGTVSDSTRLGLSNAPQIPLPAMVVTAGEKDLIRVWDADRFNLLGELSGEKKLISTVKLINEGRSLLVAGRDGSVVSYAMPFFKKTYAFYPDFEVSVIAQADDGTIMLGGSDGLLAAYDSDSLREIWRRQAHDGIVSPIVAGIGQVISASQDGAVVVTDVESGREISRAHTINGGKITDIAFINASTIVAVHEKGEIAYINLVTGRILEKFQSAQGWVSSVDVTPDGSAIVTAGVNGDLKYWPLGVVARARSIAAHSDVASGAKFLKNNSGQKLVSVGFDGRVRFWKPDGRRKIADLKHGPAILHFDYASRK